MANSEAEAKRQIERNISIHNRVAGDYEALHGEIFNDVEQARLRSTLTKARDAIRTGSQPLEALDFGSGSGNLSRHLLDLGLHVTAADVSQSFLDLVRRRFPTDRLKTLLMKGGDTSALADESIDLVATYSVLHHVPDYLGACAELARVCKAGGVVVIDHEPTEESWEPDAIYAEFRKAALRFDWRKYFVPSNYVHRVRRLFNPRHSNEGDIHVWPDDHIEWHRIQEVMLGAGFEIVHEEDYLLYRKLYRLDAYQRYLGRCTDTKVMIFRKGAT